MVGRINNFSDFVMPFMDVLAPNLKQMHAIFESYYSLVSAILKAVFDLFLSNSRVRTNTSEVLLIWYT